MERPSAPFSPDAGVPCVIASPGKAEARFAAPQQVRKMADPTSAAYVSG
jgi:hypothetical protein